MELDNTTCKAYCFGTNPGRVVKCTQINNYPIPFSVSSSSILNRDIATIISTGSIKLYNKSQSN